MSKYIWHENGFLIFEDYNFVTYTRRQGNHKYERKNKEYMNHFNNGKECLYKNVLFMENYHLSIDRNNEAYYIFKEKKFFLKIQKNINSLMLYLHKLKEKKKIRNIYLFIKFISSKCILKMSTYYYIKYIIENIYEYKLDELVRVVLPIYNIHKLYSYIYYENYCFKNYYKNLLSKKEIKELKKDSCPFIILNHKNAHIVLPYMFIYQMDVLKEGKCKTFKKHNLSNNIKYSLNDQYVFNPSNIDILCSKLKNIDIKKKKKHIMHNSTSQKHKIDQVKNSKKNKRIFKNIKIEKYKIKQTINKNLNKSNIGLFAGTFDKIHLGHILLLFYSIFLTKKIFYIGLYNNKNIYNKKYSDEIDDLKLRIFSITDILFLIKNVYQIHFIFQNFEHLNPFIKIKNAHNILYDIITNEKGQLISEIKKDKYYQYRNDNYDNSRINIKSLHKKGRKGTTNSNITNIDQMNTQKHNDIYKIKADDIHNKEKEKKQFISLMRNKMNMVYQNMYVNQNIIKCICKNLYFYINNENKDKSKNKNIKIIVLKRIHDPISFAQDIHDLYCLTISKESEINGYKLVNERRRIYAALKIQKYTKNISKNKNLIHICTKDTSHDNNKNLFFNNTYDDINNDKNISYLYQEKTTLNIFDTINLRNGEKCSSTCIRKENYLLKQVNKFYKYLKYFIEACIYFDIDYFIIQMYINLFLQRNGKKPFRKHYIRKVKYYFCKMKINNNNNNNNNTMKRKNLFIVNDFFRNMFVILSFFVNHFVDKITVHNRKSLFIKMALAISFFFYNNIILLIIKKKEQLVNESYNKNKKKKDNEKTKNPNNINNDNYYYNNNQLNFSLAKKISMFDNQEENIFKIYITNIEQLIFVKILNQILVFNILILSTCILCKMYEDFPGTGEKKKKIKKEQKEKKKNNSYTLMSTDHIFNISKKKLFSSKKNSKKNIEEQTNDICDHINSDSLIENNNMSYNFQNNEKILYSSKYIITPYNLCKYKLRCFAKKKFDHLKFHEDYLVMMKSNSDYMCTSTEKRKIKKNIDNENNIYYYNNNKKKKNYYYYYYNNLDFNKSYSINPLRYTYINNTYDLPLRERELIFQEQKKKNIKNDIKNFVKAYNTTNYSNVSNRLQNFLMSHINNNNDNNIFFYRKILIYEFLDNYFISFFLYYFLKYKVTKNYNDIYENKKQRDDFIYILLVHFENHIEMIINTYMNNKWTLKRKEENNPFDLYNKYKKKYSVIHRYFIVKLCPLNNYNIDFEKKYEFNNIKQNKFQHTPFYINLEHYNNLNVMSFYNFIFQSILKYENYYYPYFSFLSALQLNIF
ncbi:phosphopantetheine adenylyltransferase, putative [Plasmodium sp. gorilla clade G3]|nr:phosphopantetheine adenylyltransferase, putative [Plasmodium sp. gorilla clade G3]